MRPLVTIWKTPLTSGAPNPPLVIRVDAERPNAKRPTIELRVVGEDLYVDGKLLRARQRRWSKQSVVAAIERRDAAGLALNSSAVVASDEALVGAARRHWGNWDDALRAAGMDPESIRFPRVDVLPPGTWSPQLVIKLIKERHAAGEDLTAHRVQIDDSKLYSAAVYQIGSWREALTAAGLDYEQVIAVRQWSHESLIEHIQGLAEAGADLSVRTVEAFDIGLYGAARRLFEGWPQALVAAGIEEQRRSQPWDDDAILAAVELDAKGSSGGTQPGGLHAAVARRFGSWENARRAAGVLPRPITNAVRKHRRAAGLSQVKLGALVERSHRWVGLVESGAIVPDLSMALRLAAALQVGVGSLFELA